MGLFEDDDDGNYGDALDDPNTKSDTKTMDITHRITEHTAVIDYGDNVRHEIITSFVVDGNIVRLFDGEPHVYGNSTKNHESPPSQLPYIGIDRGEPIIISLHNARSVDIRPRDEVVYVARDVEYTQIYKQYIKDGEWSEAYTTFEPDPPYDIEKIPAEQWDDKQ